MRGPEQPSDFAFQPGDRSVPVALTFESNPVEPDFERTKRLLDQINAVISGYDPVLKERARDILLTSSFGSKGLPAIESTVPEDREPEPIPNESPSKVCPGAHTLKDYADTWLPRSGYDRALLALYYLRKALGLRSATGRQITKELNESGLSVANISVYMHGNARLLRVQSRVFKGKKGTKQSRNIYAITDVGIYYVETRFNLDYIEAAPSSSAPHAYSLISHKSR